MPNLVNRQQNQVARLRAGVAQGQLTRPEAVAGRVQLRDAHQQIREHRTDAEGLTRQEWRQDQLMLNGVSRQIHHTRRNERLRLQP